MKGRHRSIHRTAHRKAVQILASALSSTRGDARLAMLMAYRVPEPLFRSADSKVVAVLGPTNTGKTHLAIERLCAHSSGAIGFPLRLLAREVYDRVVAIKGREQVLDGIISNPVYGVTIELHPKVLNRFGS